MLASPGLGFRSANGGTELIAAAPDRFRHASARLGAFAPKGRSFCGIVPGLPAVPACRSMFDTDGLETPMDDLTGRVALVTGSSRGIGAEAAIALAAAGCDVAMYCGLCKYCTYRNNEEVLVLQQL